MDPVRVTVLGDGSSDKCLVYVVEWLLSDINPDFPYSVTFAERLPPAREGLSARVSVALALYPCEILIVHRDSEGVDIDCRRVEIEDSLREVQDMPPAAFAIPVRMTESWFVFDEFAIRMAADNPNGTKPLGIPALNRIEKLVDPKEILFGLLRTASGLSGRRLAKFDVHKRRHRVSQLIQDYSVLRELDSFAQFETSVRNAVDQLSF